MRGRPSPLHGLSHPLQRFITVPVGSVIIFNGASVFVNTATGHGNDPLKRDVTYCTTPVGAQLCDPDERTVIAVTVAIQ